MNLQPRLKSVEKMMKKKFWSTRLNSFYYAARGIIYFFNEGVHAKIHGIATIIVVSTGFYFKISRNEWLALLLSCALVLCAEAINTAIEKLTDMVSPGHHKQAEFVKDVAAGAVLIAAIFAVVIGLIIFIPKISMI